MSNTLEGINQTVNTTMFFPKEGVLTAVNIESFVQEKLEPYRPGITTVVTILQWELDAYLSKGEE